MRSYTFVPLIIFLGRLYWFHIISNGFSFKIFAIFCNVFFIHAASWQVEAIICNVCVFVCLLSPLPHNSEVARQLYQAQQQKFPPRRKIEHSKFLTFKRQKHLIGQPKFCIHKMCLRHLSQIIPQQDLPRATYTKKRQNQKIQPTTRAYFQLLQRLWPRPRLFLHFGQRKTVHAVCAFFRPCLMFSGNLPNVNQSPQ